MEPIVNVIGNESQKIVWITLINKGYIDFTKNFLMSIKNHCITDFELVIYCIDDESFNTFNDNELCFCIRIENSLPLELQTWGLAGYKEIVFTKLDVILSTLKNNEKHVAVGFIDTDIVLFSNPTDIFIAAMNDVPEVPIFCQCDEGGNDNICTNRRKCANICSGLIVFRNYENLYPLFDYSNVDIQMYDSDQHFLNEKLQELNISVHTIDKYICCNGQYPELQYKKVDFPTHTCSVHFNYMVGFEKVEKMKLQNLWFI